MDKIGIVILNYKKFKDTCRLVNDLLNLKIREQFQIIIVDNNSPNESYEVLKSEFSDILNVEVLSSKENGGYAKGNNFGLKALKKYNPKYALILNNDVYFDEDALISCIEKYKSLPNIGQLSPLQLLPNKVPAYLGTLRINTFLEDLLSYSFIWNKLKKKTKYISNTDYKNIRKVEIVPGSFIFIQYELFEKINFFDEDTFLFCEERFLSKKLSDKGYYNYIILDKGYVHDHSLTIKEEFNIINQKKYFNDGQIKYTLKYRNFPSFKVTLLKLVFNLFKLEIKLSYFLRKIKAPILLCLILPLAVLINPFIELMIEKSLFISLHSL